VIAAAWTTGQVALVAGLVVAAVAIGLGLGRLIWGGGSRAEAPPARAPLAEIPGEAEQAKRDAHEGELAEAAAQDPDPAATLGRLMGRK
jgi:hypothetical protein